MFLSRKLNRIILNVNVIASFMQVFTAMLAMAPDASRQQQTNGLNAMHSGIVLGHLV